MVVICQFSKVAKIDYLFIFMFFFVVLVVLWFYSDFGRIFVEKYKRNNSMFIWHATNVLKLTLCPIKWYNIGLSGLILLKLVFFFCLFVTRWIRQLFTNDFEISFSKTMMPIKCVTIQQFVLAFCDWLVAIITALFARLSFILSHAQHYGRKSGLFHIPSSPLYLLWCSR